MATSRVLLINANTLKPPIAPIGLDYVADRLRAAGFEPVLLDLVWEGDRDAAVAQAMAKVDPMAVGLTLRNTDNCYLLGNESYVAAHRDLIAGIKRQTDAPVIVGGCGYSVFGEPLRKALGADYGLRGDGESLLPALLTGISQGAPVSDGVVHGAVGLGEPQPASRRAFVDNARYFRVGGQGGIETKRGCNRACIYCADPVAKGSRMRLREPAAVADETEALVGQGVNILHTCDAEFNIPSQHAEAVCEELVRRRLGERVRWYAYCAAEGFDRRGAELMRRAGCIGINFGVDAICDEMLRRLKRGYDTEQVGVAVRACRDAGIVVMLDLLLGGPGETRETVRTTIEAAKRMGPACVGAAVGVRVYPGTEMARIVAEAGPMAANPHLHGCLENNASLIGPVFYIDRQLGERPQVGVYDVIDGDERFMVGDPDAAANYDYSDNRRLCEAIEAGARGAYWDILRQL